MAQDFVSHDELDQTSAKDHLGNALIIVTTIVLLIGFILIQKSRNERYRAGMFADKSAAPAPK